MNYATLPINFLDFTFRLKNDDTPFNTHKILHFNDTLMPIPTGLYMNPYEMNLVLPDNHFEILHRCFFDMPNYKENYNKEYSEEDKDFVRKIIMSIVDDFNIEKLELNQTYAYQKRYGKNDTKDILDEISICSTREAHIYKEEVLILNEKTKIECIQDKNHNIIHFPTKS